MSHPSRSFLCSPVRQGNTKHVCVCVYEQQLQCLLTFCFVPPAPDMYIIKLSNKKPERGNERSAPLGGGESWCVSCFVQRRCDGADSPPLVLLQNKKVKNKGKSNIMLKELERGALLHVPLCVYGSTCEDRSSFSPGEEEEREREGGREGRGREKGMPPSPSAPCWRRLLCCVCGGCSVERTHTHTTQHNN